MNNYFSFSTLNELESKVKELDLQIGFSQDLSVLAKPVSIKNITSKNSLVVHPMEGRDADKDGKPSQSTIDRYERFARGGAGIIWFEGTSVSLAGRSCLNQLVLCKKNEREFQKLVAHTKESSSIALGTSHEPLLILQLQDAGRSRLENNKNSPIVVSFSPYHNKANSNYSLLSDKEIEALESNFVESAILAEQTGFDGVDIKCCNGYIGSDFLSSFTRDGGYSGSFSHRVKFILNCVDRIRQSVSKNFIITLRLNLYDGIPYPYGWGVDKDDPEKVDLSEPIKLANLLQKRGVRIINISNGIPEYNSHLMRPYEKPLIGMKSAEGHPLEWIDKIFRITDEFQKALPDMIIVGSGYSWLRHYSLYAAAYNLTHSRVSMVGMGRMAFAYPYFANDIIKRGALNKKNVCIACSACTQLMRWGLSTGCVVRNNKYKEAYLKRKKESKMGL